MLRVHELIADYPDIRSRVESAADHDVLTAGMAPGIVWLWKALDERLLEDLTEESMS